MPLTPEEIADQIEKGMAGGALGDGSGTLPPPEDPKALAAREAAAITGATAAPSQPKPLGNVYSQALQLPVAAAPVQPIYRTIAATHDRSLIPITDPTLAAIRGDQEDVGRGIGIAGQAAEQGALGKAGLLSQSAITSEQKAAALQALKDQAVGEYGTRQAAIDKATAAVGGQEIKSDRRGTLEKIGDMIANAGGIFAATRSHTQNFAGEQIQAKLAADQKAQEDNLAHQRAKLDAMRQSLGDFQTQHGITRADLAAAHAALTEGQDKRIEAQQSAALAPQIKGKSIIELAQNKLGIDKAQGQLESASYVPRHQVQVGGFGPAKGAEGAQIDLRRAVPTDEKGGVTIFNTPEEAAAYKAHAAASQDVLDAIASRQAAFDKANAGLGSKHFGPDSAALHAEQARLKEATRRYYHITRPGENADEITNAAIGDPFAFVGEHHDKFQESLSKEIQESLAARRRLGMAQYGKGGIIYDKEGGAKVGVLAQPKYEVPNPGVRPSTFTPAAETTE